MTVLTGRQGEAMRPSSLAPSRGLLLLLPLVALVPQACRNPAELRWAVRPGTIVYNQQVGSMVILPTQVVAGQAAPVTVYTFGNGCVAPAYTNTTVSGAIAIVEPFDSVVVQLPPHMTCTDELNAFPHSVSVVFPQAGAGRILIIGWNHVTETDDTLDYNLTVQ